MQPLTRNRRYESPDQSDPRQGLASFVFAVKKAVLTDKYDLDLDLRQWGLIGQVAARSPLTYGDQNRLNLEFSRALAEVKDLPVELKTDKDAVFTHMATSMSSAGNGEPGVAIRYDEVVSRLTLASDVVARGHKGLALSAVAYDEPDSVRAFLDREAEYARATVGKGSSARGEVLSSKRDAMDGASASFGSVAARPVISKGRGREERLSLVATPQDVIDVMFLRQGIPPVHKEDTRVTRTDANGETQETLYKSGDPRRAPVAYVLLNNANALRALANGELPIESLALRRDMKAVEIFLDRETLSLNAEASKSPAKALAVLKDAVGVTRERLVQLDQERGKIRKLAQSTGMEM